MTVTLRTWQGKFLCAEPDGHVVGDRDSAGPWEQWQREDSDDGTAFRSVHGLYLCAEPNGRVVADRVAVGPWERFQVEAVDGRVALRTVRATYVCVEPDGHVIADRHAVGEWERFEVRTVDGPAPAPQPTPQPPQSTTPPSTGGNGGGLWTTADDTRVRPRLSADDIRRLLPARRGPFRFPSPWNTQGIRLTDDRDRGLRPIGMSYWPNCNNWAGHSYALVFLSLNDRLTLFSVDTITFEVRNEGELPYQATGEACYWSFTDKHLLYVPQGRRLLRYDVARRVEETVFEAPTEVVQPHSSADGTVHSFTYENGPAVFRNRTISRWSPNGSYDECQVTKCGEYLVSKELSRSDNQYGNRIIHLPSDREWYLTRTQGGVGHSDTGYRLLIGEDNQAQPGGVFRRWDLTPDGPQDAGAVFHLGGWPGLTRYVSCCAATPGPPEAQVALFSSSSNDDRSFVNELVATRTNGSLRCVAVCPTLVDLHGGDEYWLKARANLDPTGAFAVWTAEVDGAMHAFMVRLPRW